MLRGRLRAGGGRMGEVHHVVVVLLSALPATADVLDPPQCMVAVQNVACTTLDEEVLT